MISLPTKLELVMDQHAWTGLSGNVIGTGGGGGGGASTGDVTFSGINIIGND
jgi:hypothetical protein